MPAATTPDGARRGLLHDAADADDDADDDHDAPAAAIDDPIPPPLQPGATRWRCEAQTLASHHGKKSSSESWSQYLRGR